MSDVFISYKREDRDKVDVLVEVLVDLGLDVWFDGALENAELWSKRIEREVAAASAVVVCWSQSACRSDWVLQEARTGLQRDVLVQCKFERCDPPMPFADFQASDLSAWTGSPAEPEFQRLLFRLQSLTGRDQLARNGRLRAGGQHQELVAILRAILVDRARRREPPLTYIEAEQTLKNKSLAARIKVGEFDQNSLWGALDAIADQNRRAREPPLFALVVSPHHGGLPGRGYFQKHVFLSGVQDELARQVFARHLDRVYRFNWPRDP